MRPAALDESVLPGEDPATYVERLAQSKAEALWDQLPLKAACPSSAPTPTVALGKLMLGKPANSAESRAMLEQLSGRTHQVFTAVALRSEAGCEARVSVSNVTFRDLTPREMEAYAATPEPLDKAGGYAVQGLAAVFITRIAGSYSGIMGLPLSETAELLTAIGWAPFAPAAQSGAAS